MTTRTWDRTYDSHVAFYQDVYPEALVETQTLGRLGATLMVSEQCAGDWSDAPVPELVLTRLLTQTLPATMDIGSGRFRAQMPRSGFVVIPPNFATTFLIDAAHRVELVALNYRRLLDFAGGPSESGLPVDGDFGWLHTSALTDRETGRIMDRLCAEAQAGNPHGALGADGLLLQLAAALLRLRDAKPPKPRSAGLPAWQVRRVCDYLAEHLAEDLALSDLAALVGLSPSHFCRAFAASLGVPPHRWLMARRIERAKELLNTTTLSITSIAAVCGFASSQHFASAFRKAIGATPSAYRR